MKKIFTLFAFLLTAAVYGQQAPETQIQDLEQRLDNLEKHVLSYKKNDFETAIGGAARFNYSVSSWDDAQLKKGGDLKYDVFYLTALARYKDFSIHAEYRFYSKANGGAMLNNAYFQYLLKKEHRFQFGLMRVPFGNTENSFSFYFSLAYFVGLEGDDDAGIKYTFNNKNFEIDAAFFKNSDFNFGSNHQVDPSRFSVDVSGQNQETNQLNGRFIWKFGENVKSRLGVSGMYGGLYNIFTGKTGNHYAAALHYQVNAGNWTARAQWANYGYNPKNDPAGDPAEMPGTVTVGAYGSTYRIAGKGNLYTASVKYDIPLKNRKVLNSLNVYGEFGYLDKSDKNFADTQLHLLGVNLNIWKVSIYAEYIAGKNHPFLGTDWDNALGAGDKNAKWQHKFNINFGFYF